MDKIIEDVELIKIDKSKKYCILLKDREFSEVEEIAKRIRNWLDRENDPIVIFYGDKIELLEVEKDE